MYVKRKKSSLATRCLNYKLLTSIQCRQTLILLTLPTISLRAQGNVCQHEIEMIYRMISQLSSMRILTKNKRVLQILKHALNILLSNKKHQLVYNHPFNMSNYLLQHTCGVNPVLPNNASIVLFFVWSLYMQPQIASGQIIVAHGYRCQRWDSTVECRNFITGEKNSLVVGGTRTRVLANSIAIVPPSRL